MYTINNVQFDHQIIDNEDVVGNFLANEFSNHIPDANPKAGGRTHEW